MKNFKYDFHIPENLNELANFIGMDEKLLIEASSLHKTKNINTNSQVYEKIMDIFGAVFRRRIGDIKEPLYFKHLIPKKNPKKSRAFRVAWEANFILADAYKAFARRFELFVSTTEPRFPHDCAFGYVRGRSTFDNAYRHCEKAIILHADIENFFPSISRDKITRLFIGLGIKNDVAEILGRFLTIENSLPLGLHPSPMLANIICLDLDDKLLALAKRCSCVYTRYADDITISGSTAVPTKEEVESILTSEGFKLSEKKFRITKIGQSHFVTGLSVSDAMPRAPRRMKRKLRQELHYCKKFGIEEHIKHINNENLVSEESLQSNVNRIDGTVRYVSSIEQHHLPKLRYEWQNCMNSENLGVSYQTLLKDKAREICYFIDEAEITYNERKFLAIGLAQTQSYKEIQISTAAVLRRYIADPHSTGKKQPLQKNKLHFGDCDQDLRRAYIEKMAVLPFKGYVVYRELISNQKYEETYLSLIKEIMPHRFMGCDGDIMILAFEENAKISKHKLQNILEGIQASLEKSNNRRPINYRIKTVKKSEEPCISVPDFLLGMFSKYARQNDKKDGALTEREEALFEKLRDKYRIILNADVNLVYSRKRPFVPWD